MILSILFLQAVLFVIFGIDEDLLPVLNIIFRFYLYLFKLLGLLDKWQLFSLFNNNGLQLRIIPLFFSLQCGVFMLFSLNLSFLLFNIEKLQLGFT